MMNKEKENKNYYKRNVFNTNLLYLRRNYKRS